MNGSRVRPWWVVVALMTFLVLISSPALAHATYKSSDPANKSTVSSPPREITAEFTEPMTGRSYMDVTDPCGRDVGSGSELTGNRMRVQNSGAAAGTYVVYWLAESIDGHKTEGEFTFTSTGGDPCPGEAKEKPSGGGGNGGGNSGGGSASSTTTVASGGGSDSSSTTVASNEGRKTGSRGQHDRHRRGATRRASNQKTSDDPSSQDAGSLTAAQTDPPEAPSALEGIPRDGLLITLAVSMLIGAAAGKVYVSLSGDDS